MNGRSWFETKPDVPLTSWMRDMLAGRRIRLEELTTAAAKKIVSEQISKLEKDIEAREKDQRFRIEVKHIGSEDDPLHFEDLKAKRDAAQEDARLRARRKMLDELGADNLDDDVINAMASSDPVLVASQKGVLKQIIVEGIVGGEDAFKRLAKLGGGPLIREAAHEVMHWQEVSFEKGES